MTDTCKELRSSLSRMQLEMLRAHLEYAKFHVDNKITWELAMRWICSMLSNSNQIGIAGYGFLVPALDALAHECRLYRCCYFLVLDPYTQIGTLNEFL